MNDVFISITTMSPNGTWKNTRVRKYNGVLLQPVSTPKFGTALCDIFLLKVNSLCKRHHYVNSPC